MNAIPNDQALNILHTVSDSIFIQDRNGIIQFVNDVVIDTYGYSRNEILDEQLEFLATPEMNDWDLIRQCLKNAWKGHTQTFEFWSQSKHGTPIPLEIKLNKGIIDEQEVLVAVARDITSHKEAEQQIHESEDKFRALAEKSLVGVYLIQDGIFKYVNPKFAQIFGFKVDEIQDRLSPMDLTHPRDREKVDQNIQQRISGKTQSIHYEFVGITKNHASIELEAYGNRTIFNGKPALIGSLIDITPRKKQEAQLRQSEELFRQLFQNAPNAIAQLDSENQVLKINPRFGEMFGYTEAEVTGININDLVVPESERTQAERFTSLSYDGNPIQGEAIRKTKDGKHLNVLVASVPVFIDGKTTFVYAIYLDITERKQIQAELQKEKEFVESAINSLPGIFFLFNEHSRLQRWNRNLEQVTGYTDTELQNRPLDAFIPDEDLQAVTRAMDSKTTHRDLRLETYLITKSGQQIPYYLTGHLLVSNNNRYIVGTGIDFSHRKKAEENVKKSLREKEVLLEEIHHRVKNNLAVINGLLELQSYNTENLEVKNLLKDSQSRIHSMALVHEQLYQMETLSEIELGNYIEQLVHSIKQMIHDTQNDIHFSMHADPIYLTITQAVPCGLLLNEIITNAFKHAFIDQDEGEIRIDIVFNDPKITLKIVDNGAGLPENFDINKPDSLGMTLIRTLSKQLEAELEINGDDGTRYLIQFDKE